MDKKRIGAVGALLCVALAGCASTTRITAQHNPLYRAQPHTSTITATASNTDKKIAEIRIDVMRGEMTACTENGGFPSLIPCRTGTSFQARICPFPSHPASATCTFSMALGDRRLVTYTVTARTASGQTSTSQPITYAAGASLTQVTFGILGLTITQPWDVARPVWWHTETGGRSEDHINVGFFPDPDFASYLAFTNALQPLLLGAHFDLPTPFSQNYTFWRGVFDLWAGPPGADANMGPPTGPICTWNFTGMASNIAGVMDGEAILHTTNFRDCASISLGGTGTVWTGAASPSFNYVHESGHFLQGLSDEYCCNGGYFSVSTPPNIHGSESACQSTATSIGVATSLCVQVGTTGSWRIDDGSLEIMDDVSTSADWRDAASRAIQTRVNACTSGNCY